MVGKIFYSYSNLICISIADVIGNPVESAPKRYLFLIHSPIESFISFFVKVNYLRHSVLYFNSNNCTSHNYDFLRINWSRWATPRARPFTISRTRLCGQGFHHSMSNGQNCRGRM